MCRFEGWSLDCKGIGGGGRAICCGREAWVFCARDQRATLDASGETYKASYFTILRNNDQYPIIECLDEKLCLDFTNR